MEKQKKKCKKKGERDMLLVLKCYAIVAVLLSGVFNLWEGIKERDREDIVSFLFTIPVLVYLLLK